MKYYKFLLPGLKAPFNDNFSYPAPKRGKPGKWTKKVDRILECSSGYHACSSFSQLIRFFCFDNSTLQDVDNWVSLFLVEVESQDPWYDSVDKSLTCGPVRITKVYRKITVKKIITEKIFTDKALEKCITSMNTASTRKPSKRSTQKAKKSKSSPKRQRSSSRTRSTRTT